VLVVSLIFRWLRMLAEGSGGEPAMATSYPGPAQMYLYALDAISFARNAKTRR
jgi:hypothetical protein